MAEFHLHPVLPGSDAAPRPALLTYKGTQVLLQVERLMDDAKRDLGGRPADGAAKESKAGDDRSFAAAADAPAVRGN